MTKDKLAPTKAKNCGTPSGYRGHSRRGERACEPCRAANSAYQRQRREKVKRGEPTAKPTKKSKREEGEAVGAAMVAYDQPVEDEPSKPYPMYLNAAGRRLWREVTDGYDLNPAALQVLTHACRMTDKLERFDAALSSRSSLWFELDTDEADVDKGVPIVVNGMIGEGRQLANAIRTALSQIGVLKTTAGGSKTSVQDQIKAKREERLRRAKAEEGGVA